MDTNKDLHGAQQVFIGTQVPMDSLFDRLEAGASLEEFLVNFPTVSKEQAVALLEEALPFGTVIVNN